MPKEILDFLHFVFEDPIRYALLWVGGMVVYIVIRAIFETAESASYQLAPKVTKKRLCEQGVAWCTHRLGKAQVPISITLNYARRQGRRLGSYRTNGEMILHVNHGQHQDFRHLANTIIHEYTHALQFNNRRNRLRYDEETARVGYYENPFEVEARAVADRLEEELFEYWKSVKLIIND